MTVEQALIIAVGSLAGLVLFFGKDLYRRAAICEKDRDQLRNDLSNVMQVVSVIRACPASECPTAATIHKMESESYSLHLTLERYSNYETSRPDSAVSRTR